MMVSHRHRIVYVSVPKVACSSLKYMMHRLETGRDYDAEAPHPDGGLWGHIHRHHPSTLFDRIDWAQYDGYWRFAVIRDPVKRLLSCYTDKILGQKVLHHQPPKPWRPQAAHDLWARLDKDPSLDTFFLNIMDYREASGPIRRHTLPAWKFLGTDLGHYDRVYRIEELDQLQRDLSARIGEDVTLPRRNTSTHRRGADDLSPPALARLRKYCRRDYDLMAGYYAAP